LPITRGCSPNVTIDTLNLSWEAGASFFTSGRVGRFWGDLNPDLIAAYEGIRDNWSKVQTLLRRHQRNHGDEHYYAVRASQPRGVAQRAARLIYLNRTCFNGVYRVNRQGLFNVPKGTRDSVVFETDDYQSIAALLSGARIWLVDFEELIDGAGSGDLIFADPPYTVRHNRNAFVKYNETLFSWNDQVRLAHALMRARKRGATIVSTNANHRSIRALYSNRCFKLRALSRFSPISADPEKRRRFSELVIATAG